MQDCVLSLTLLNIVIHDIADDIYSDVHYIMYANDVTFFMLDVDPKKASLRLEAVSYTHLDVYKRQTLY